MKPISMDLRERVPAACDAGVAPKSCRNKRVPLLATRAEEIRILSAATPRSTGAATGLRFSGGP